MCRNKSYSLSLRIIGGLLQVNSYPMHVNDVQSLVLNAIKPLEIVLIPFAEIAGYVLAEDIESTEDIPLFNRSMMDGFAIRYEDVLQASVVAPAHLNVIEEVAAGAVPLKTIGVGEAARIMTGAMIPPGANAVCRFEATKDFFLTGVRSVGILAPQLCGANIALQGEDIPIGTVILKRGHRIGAAEIAVLATFGKQLVPVFRKPKVGILSSGSELIEVDQPMTPGKIRNSNSYMVAALIQQAGGLPIVLKPTADNEHALIAEINSILDKVDVLVTTGGVSVGDYDLIPAVFDKLGAVTHVSKVLMRPGSPFCFAIRNNIPLIGLSGNPAAAFVHTQLFVLPVIRQMSGVLTPEPRFTKALLTSSLPAKAPIKHTRFLRATAYLEEGLVKVAVATGQSSGMIGSFIGANCLVRLSGGLSPGPESQVDILLYDEVKIR